LDYQGMDLIELYPWLHLLKQEKSKKKQ
jgi:hypothetical protein